MAYDHRLYIRRSSELGIDPEYRIGKLTYVCRLLSDHHNAVCGALMLCDCGKFTKIGLPSLYKGGDALPYECESCVREGKRKSKALKSHFRKRKSAEVKRRKKLFKNQKYVYGTLRKNYPSEYYAWFNCRFVYKHAVDVTWTGKFGFLNFMKDMGAKPWPKSRFCRRDTLLPYTKENAYWSKPQQSKPKQPNPQ